MCVVVLLCFVVHLCLFVCKCFILNVDVYIHCVFVPRRVLFVLFRVFISVCFIDVVRLCLSVCVFGVCGVYRFCFFGIVCVLVFCCFDVCLCFVCVCLCVHV